VYGQRLHLDLEKNPDQALDPVIAARVLASYFKHWPGLVEACEQENWREVRRLVNGQYNGWERFHAAAKVAAAADATAVRPAK
jgi:predicted chitinase